MALILLGGLSLLTGTQPKIGASLITAFLLGVTPQMHAFLGGLAFLRKVRV